MIWSFWSFCVGLLSRFVEIIHEAMIEFIEEQENTNTKIKIAYDVELFKNSIQTSNPDLLGSTSLHELSPQVLNDYLSKFIRRKALGHLMKFTQGRLKYT